MGSDCNVLRYAVQSSKAIYHNGAWDMQKTSSLMVRLDEESKSLLASAAELRQISVSDYVRSIVVGQAKRELAAAQSQTIAMTQDEQVQFWNALSKVPKPTKAQKELGKLMRGEA